MEKLKKRIIELYKDGMGNKDEICFTIQAEGTCHNIECIECPLSMNYLITSLCKDVE